MADIPEENITTIQKRQAIQTVMRDKSLTPSERNKKMQSIMAGKFELPQAEAELLEPMIHSDSTRVVPPPPPREEMERRSSAKDMIDQFDNNAQDDDDDPLPNSAPFHTIGSAGGRGHGPEERRKTKPSGTNDNDGDDNHGGHTDDQAGNGITISAEEKKKRAFIPKTLVASNRKIVEERIMATSAAAEKSESSDSNKKLNEYEARVRAKSNSLRSTTTATPVTTKISRPGAGSRSNVDMGDFEQRLMKKTLSNDRSITGGDNSSSQASSLEQRILANTRSNAASTSSGAVASADSQSSRFEQRILEKSRSNSAARSRSSSRTRRGGASSTNPLESNKGGAAAVMDEFEARILKKTALHDSMDRARSAAEIRLEQRILEKTRSNDAVTATSASSTSSQRLDEFEHRILEKSRSTSAARSRSNSRTRRGGASSTIDLESNKGSAAGMDEFEARILKKTASHGNSAAEVRSEQRILEKTRSNDAVTTTSASSTTSQRLDESEQRILEKTKLSNNNATVTSKTNSRSRTAGGKPSADHPSNSKMSMDEFQERITKKTTSFDSLSSAGSARSGRSAKDSLENPLERRIMENIKSNDTAAGLGGDSHASSRLERRIMEKNKPSNTTTVGSLGASSNAQARFEQRYLDKSNSNLTFGSTRSTDTGNSTIIGHGVEETTNTFENGFRNSNDSHSSSLGTGTWQEEDVIAPVAQDEGDDGMGKKRRAIQEVQRDTSLDLQERNRRMQAIMAGNWDEYDRLKKPSAQDEGDDGDDGMGRKRRAIQEVQEDASLDPQERNRRMQAIMAGNWEDYDNLKTCIADRSTRGISNRSSFLDENDRGGLAEESHPGVGFGSLPLPEEHFVPSARSPLEEPSHPQIAPIDVPDIAVATALAPDDEPEYIYNAIEWDPEAKPPLHRNRRFRFYTYFAFAMIGIVVIFVVVYITSASKQSETDIIVRDYKAQPTLSPTSSPITNREASGVLEQLEAGILYVRNETFADMDRGDPRMWALDWILHKDGMQLVSDDFNLYQRFALAVLAYSMDSEAWYYCGGPGTNFNDTQCYIFSGKQNTTVPYGDTTVWLSSTDECTWFGVTCSSDGIVRGVDLSTNDLIGVLPYELTALRFIQKLHLRHNCIIGTIPPELGQMRHLLSLELHGNGLSGEMPRAIYDLENLQLLNLAEQYGGDRECTKTDGRVVDINYRMGGLGVRYEENVGLTGTLGPEIGEWRSMKGLYLFKNSFEGVIPESIGNLRYLRYLRLNDNYIGGSLPKTITKLKKLRELQLGDNFLVSSLPSDLGRMTDLRILTLNGNSLFGEIPNGLYNLKKLSALRLDDTLMREDPWLAVPNEGINGSISTFIGGLQDLEYLYLNNNPISGTIPTELGLCEKLKTLLLHRTNIEGEMPDKICPLRDKSLSSVYSDCRPYNGTAVPFIKCDCCSDCCDHSTGVCIADD